VDHEGAEPALVRDLTHPEPGGSEVHTDDALLEFPQSGERFRAAR
jgi:hypothetical protein